jgi:CO/xanthine dehydrogenase Mo-binding subunit
MVAPYIGTAFNVIGKRGVPRRFGYTKAAGTAAYTRDIVVPGMLYAKSLRSPCAHARIKSMDTSKAAAYPGVRGVLRYDDADLKAAGLDETLRGEAHYEGQPVGAVVAADTLQIAEEATRLISVEWEQLAFYLDPAQALAANATILYPEQFPKSNEYTTFLSAFLGGELSRPNPDIAGGLAQADAVIDTTIYYTKMQHAGAEARCYVYKWEGDELTIWSHTQTPSTEGPSAQGDRLLIPRLLKMPASKLNVKGSFQGGSYGGTISLEHINVAVAFLSKKIQTPISFLQNRSDEQGRGDAGLVCKLKIGAKKDGTITAIQLTPIVDVGDSGIEGEGFIWAIVSGAKPPDMLNEVLTCPNITTDTKLALTSKTCATSFRCEKNQTSFILGKVTELVAEKLGIDPVTVVLKNGNCATNSLAEVVKAGKEAIGWDSKWHLPGTKTLANGKMHGMGLSWAHMWHSGGNSQVGSVCISIDYDGSVQLSSCVCDCGVSAHTSYIMIVAEETGVSVDNIHFSLGDSNSGFALKSPGGSIGLTTNSYILRKAAKGLKAKILDAVAAQFKVTAAELDIKDSTVFVIADPTNKKTLAELGSSLGNGAFPIAFAMDATTPPYEQIPPYHCFQVHMAEVEVDPETGKVDVTNVVNVNDLGQMIRPESCEGQMYGGYYMAWGRNMSEEIIYDASTGVRLNDNLLDYKYSLMLDSAFPNVLAKEIAKDVGEYGLVGAGEPTSTVADSLLNNAISNAIGVSMNKNPVLPQDILAALGKA